MFKRFWWIMLVFIPIGMFCGVLLAAGASYLMPKTFESRCVMELRLPPITFRPVVGWFDTQMEKAISRECLEPVVEKQVLIERWAMDREACVVKLRKAVSVDPIQATDLFTISVSARTPEDARDLAQAVTQSYTSLLDKDLDGNEGHPSNIIVHSAPELPTKAVSPNVLLNLFAGSAAGVLFGLVMALPVMALLHRKSKAAPAA